MLITLAGILAVVGALAGAYYFAMRPVSLRIAVGPANSDDIKVVHALTQAFAQAHSRIRLRPMQTDGAAASAQALGEGNDPSMNAYRQEAWAFLLNGGAVYDGLDWSFTLDSPNGLSATSPVPASGGGAQLRGWLGSLRSFMGSIDFVHMGRNPNVITAGVPGSAWALAWSTNGSIDAGEWLPYALIVCVVMVAALLSGIAVVPSAYESETTRKSAPTSASTSGVRPSACSAMIPRAT